MTSMPRVNLDIDADHSCNWKCCFGCKCEKSPKSKSNMTTEKAQDVFRKFHNDMNTSCDSALRQRETKNKADSIPRSYSMK